MGLENKRAAGNRFVRLSLNQLSGIDAPPCSKRSTSSKQTGKKRLSLLFNRRHLQVDAGIG
jgi:hypothetical protein